jgi:hypothetical protein
LCIRDGGETSRAVESKSFGYLSQEQRHTHQKVPQQNVHGGQQKRIGDVLKNKIVVFACVFCKNKFKKSLRLSTEEY